MKQVLTIGYQHFVLPASANLNGLIQTLSKAQTVQRKWRDNDEVYFIDGPAKVQIALVEDKLVIDPKKLKRLPANAGPDAHNTDIGEEP